MPERWPKTVDIARHCRKMCNRSFSLHFLLDMRSTCGRVGAHSSTAPLRAAVAAVVPEAAHACDRRLAASTPLRCPRRPHARPCPTPARVATAPAWGLRWCGGRASEACPHQRLSGPSGLPADSPWRPWRARPRHRVTAARGKMAEKSGFRSCHPSPHQQACRVSRRLSVWLDQSFRERLCRRLRVAVAPIQGSRTGWASSDKT
jgi:hypothetical protein